MKELMAYVRIFRTYQTDKSLCSRLKYYQKMFSTKLYNNADASKFSLMAGKKHSK